jgi:intracellular multiplication protein IcmQ
MEEIAKQLREIIENILNASDWKASIFFKQSSTKLRNLLIESDRLCKIFAAQKTTTAQKNGINKNIKQEIQFGFIQVYVLLYQTNGDNLDAWYENIKSLTSYSANKSVYKNQNHIEEFIRSKKSNMTCNGYVVVNVKNSDFYNIETPAFDIYNHELVVLKEAAIKLENIVEFVLANKQRYIIENSKLVLVE